MPTLTEIAWKRCRGQMEEAQKLYARVAASYLADIEVPEETFIHVYEDGRVLLQTFKKADIPVLFKALPVGSLERKNSDSDTTFTGKLDDGTPIQIILHAVTCELEEKMVAEPRMVCKGPVGSILREAQ